MKAIDSKHRWLCMAMVVWMWACNSFAGTGVVDLDNLPNYANQTIPSYITRDNTPVDNPITDKGALLGRVLFYDKQLSSNNTVACATCHKQSHGFSDPDIASQGVNGTTGRHSMRLINARFSDEANFFWDERVPSTEEQVTKPIQDHNEMGFSGSDGDPSFSDLITKMEGLSYYPRLFEEVFGDSTITEDRMKLAIAQFVRSIQSFDSKFDQGRAMAPSDVVNFQNFTADENAGKTLFFQPGTFTGSVRTGGGGGCAGCHQGPEFSIDPNSGNNGAINAIGGGTDRTNTKSPSLRDLDGPFGTNGPFMHDGNDASIEDAIEHYSSGIVGNMGLDGRLRRGGGPAQLNFTTTEKAQLAAFLRTLTGSNVYTDEKWSDPFAVNGELTVLPIEKTTPTVTLASSANPSDLGASFTITATVAAVSPATGTPTGTVTFNNGESSFATVTLDGNGQASFSSNQYSVGTHTFTATYNGDDYFNSASSSGLAQTIELPPNNDPAANAGSDQTVVVGETVSLNGAFTDVDGIDTHTFAWDYNYNGESFTADTTDQNTTTTYSSPGTYTVYFRVTDSRGGYDYDSLIITVEKADVVANITSNSPNPSEEGEAVTFTATFAAASPGSGTITGTARWYAGEQYFGESTITGEATTKEITFSSAGTYNINVRFPGDSSYNSNNSSTVEQVVTVPKKVTSLSVTRLTNPAIQGESNQLQITMGFESYVGIPTEPILLYLGETQYKSDTMDADAEAHFGLHTLPIGSHELTAVFEGNDTYKASSTTFTLVVFGGYDFGDAPETETSYLTTLANDGARHKITDLFLGSGVTKEEDGQPTASADGDTDDGVTIPALEMGTTVEVTVVSSGAGKLDAWIDWNSDEEWEPSEKVLSSYDVSAGSNIIPIEVPCIEGQNDSVARFRLSSAGGLSTTGEAEDGEVEDYVVTIQDTIPPVLTVPDDISINNDPGTCGARVMYTVTATDNCGTPTLVGISTGQSAPHIVAETPAPASGSTFEGGVTWLTFTATDNFGNKSVDSFKITVNDTEAPVITGPSDVTIEADSRECSASYDYSISATDNCSLVLLTNLKEGLPSGSEFPVGTTTVTWEYTDDSGNKSTHSFNVTVTDNAAPSFTLKSVGEGIHFIGYLGLDGTLTVTSDDLVATTMDCSEVSFSLSESVFTTADIGFKSITVTATDAFDNSSAQTAELVILAGLDFGDAPDTYGTLMGSDGARHKPIEEDGILGTARDLEADGLPGSTATGDDEDITVQGDSTDEDGITFPELLRGGSATLVINVLGATSKLDGWIDWNHNGVFDHPSEQVADSVSVASGETQLQIDVPSSALGGDTYARFRLSRDGDLSPTGGAEGGEVEDYRVSVTANTLPPSVAQPLAETSYGIQVPIQYTLPEDLGGEAVELSFIPAGLGFENQLMGFNYGLATSSAGQQVIFNFNAANPTSSSEVLYGDPLPDGTYDVSISYVAAGSEVLGRTEIVNVTVDTSAQTPVLIAPEANAKFSTSLSLGFELPEAPLSGSIKVVFDSSNNSLDRSITLSSSINASGFHSVEIPAGDPLSSELISGITPSNDIPLGTYSIYLQYQDAVGNTGFSASVSNVSRIANDPTLSALNITGGTLVPSFQPSIFQYSITLPYGQSAVGIEAIANLPNATVTLTGQSAGIGSNGTTRGIPVGETSLTIGCIHNTDFLLYQLTITREEEVIPVTELIATSALNTTVNTPLAIAISEVAGPERTDALFDETIENSSAGGSFIRTAPDTLTYTPPTDFVGEDHALLVFHSMEQTFSVLVTIRVSGNPEVRLLHTKMKPAIEGDDVEVTFAGLPGVEYILEASDDLKTWSQIGTLVAGPTGELILLDEGAMASNTHRFYRVRRVDVAIR